MHFVRPSCITCWLIVACGFGTPTSRAAEYRLVPGSGNVLAGDTLNLAVEVETQPGDNLVDVGHFSFAIDLTLTGDAGAVGSDVSNIVINEVAWDDTLSSQFGAAVGDQWIGTGGVTTDAFAPNFGAAVGNVIGLFTFDLTIPVAAPLHSTITITPTEGFLQNLTVNDSFDPVFPQNFAATTLTIVPEPTSALLAVMAAAMFIRRQ